MTKAPIPSPVGADPDLRPPVQSLPIPEDQENGCVFHLCPDVGDDRVGRCGMSNPLVSTRVEVPEGCAMRGEVASYGVLFTVGSIADALDVPVDLVFALDALRRFVDLATEMLAVSESDGPP